MEVTLEEIDWIMNHMNQNLENPRLDQRTVVEWALVAMLSLLVRQLKEVCKK